MADEQVVYTGVIRYPTIMYVAIEDEGRARAACPDMEVIADWRIRPGCWFCTSRYHEIPPMPEGWTP